MRRIEDIINNHRYIYSDGLEIGKDGLRGYMTVNNMDMTFVASFGGGWDHISVSPLRKDKIPSWDMMCKVKEIFFEDNEAVIQIHPPKDEYVNNMPNCFHLWRANDKDMILPPSFMVGYRKGQTAKELEEEIDRYYEENGYER
jgi:hypothetical protein